MRPIVAAALFAVSVSCRDYFVAPEAPDAGSGLPTDGGAGGGGCDATFCDDFDVAALGERWSAMTAPPGTPLMLDSSDRVSPPRSLLARQEQALESSLTKTVGRATEITVSSAIRVDDVAPEGFNAIVVEQGNLSLVLAVDPDKTTVREELELPGGGEDPRVLQLASGLVAGTFRQVELSVSFVTRRLVAKVEGQIVLDDSLRPTIDGTAGERDGLMVRIGIVYANGPGSARARFDDFVLIAR